MFIRGAFKRRGRLILLNGIHFFQKVSPKKKPETEKKKKTETKKKVSKQPTIKLPSPKKKKSVSPKKRKAEDNSDDDDEPLLKKAKESAPPTDAELKKVVSSILQGADLEHLTMKTVVKQVLTIFIFKLFMCNL